MGKFLNGISLFMVRHMDGGAQPGAAQAPSEADVDSTLNSHPPATVLPALQTASSGPAPAQRVEAENVEASGSHDGHDPSDAQLPLVPFATRHETFAAPKSRHSRTMNLQRASTSVTVPSRAVVTTRNHPTRLHDTSPPTLTLTETERVRLQIMQVQIRLQSIALYEGPIDGVLNPETATGLRHFQTLKGLRPTGTLAAGTLSALGVRQIN